MSEPSSKSATQPAPPVSDKPAGMPSAERALNDLRARFPETSFLALGQTALWDEPTKAALRGALDQFWPDARLIAATHDTDYFAKLPGHPPAKEHGKYALVLHDDTRTQGLWSAAAEMSRLFGSEDVSTRDALSERGGVTLARALSNSSEADAVFLLSELTAAWGWTGIIYTHWDRKISRDIPLADILLALRDQMEWAIEGTVACLSGERAVKARATGNRLVEWVNGFARSHPGASLTDLYRDLSPRLYELLLNAPASNLATSSTTELLRFNTATASLPRFQFVDLFLNPITRRVALDAYNLSVGGSDIYTLDRFAPGAIPFDLVVPGRGRGTICITGNGRVQVDTPNPITLCESGCDFSRVEKFADLVERELGPDCTLVGKAVALLPMLAAEFVIVFHEGASSYADRSRAVVTHIRRRGIALPPYRPILRMRYDTWDALEAIPPIGMASDPNNQFRLPEFLTQAFGRETIPISEFAACWRCAVSRENDRLNRLAEMRSPRDLLAYLTAEDTSEPWGERARAYDAATIELISVREEALPLLGRAYTLLDQIRADKTAAERLERAKGDDFRARVQPVRERLAAAHAVGDAAEIAAGEKQFADLQAERALRFDAEIANRRGQIRYALATIRDLKEKRLKLERGQRATTARATLRRIAAQAETAKARLARNALQAVNGLPHTNYRPTAWWLPLVDPTGSWFKRLAETTEYYLEEM